MSILKDHKRFLDVVKGRVKENLKKYISHDQFIARSEKDYVKISIPVIEIPRLKYGFPQQQGQYGSGKGGAQPSSSQHQGEGGRGQAGAGDGVHLMDADISFDELADLLGKELQLPRIENKGSKNLKTKKTQYSTRSLKGPMGLRHFKETYKQSLKRHLLEGTYDEKNPIIVPEKSDFRFKSYKEKKEPKSNAAVIYIMDVSGSMGEEQKEIVRIESFWLNTWLKKNYKGIDTRFIIHDANAKEVDEFTFFRTSESGGTLISSAYKLCRKIIEKDYPSSDWNVYPFHFSDGDNWSGEDTRFCLKILKEFFLERVNLFGYGQVESKYGSGQFAKDLEKEFKNDERIIVSRIESKEKIVDSIRDFFKKGY